MEVNNLLDIHTGEELYNWYLHNHDKAKDFRVRVNRADNPFPGVVGYIDAVEVALGFGWIDSTQKRIDDGKPVQHYSALYGYRKAGAGKIQRGWDDGGKLRFQVNGNKLQCYTGKSMPNLRRGTKEPIRRPCLCKVQGKSVKPQPSGSSAVLTMKIS